MSNLFPAAAAAVVIPVGEDVAVVTIVSYPKSKEEFVDLHVLYPIIILSGGVGGGGERKNDAVDEDVDIPEDVLECG